MGKGVQVLPLSYRKRKPAAMPPILAEFLHLAQSTHFRTLV
ncbi:MAG: hypothetical protein BWX86_00968 [Verrucomicrobia bacterium ADurb.Bin122]|nr:MAG: hypothetical protein BWX86_00968 [Verrucomicrobia bacterium ADurb.Bin122]